LGAVTDRGLGARPDLRGHLRNRSGERLPSRDTGPAGYTWHGALHDFISLPAFLALAAACFVFGRRFAARGERGWVVYSVVSGLVFAVMFVLASAGFGQAEGLVDLAGLFQRVAVTVGFGWLTLLAVHLLRSPSKWRNCL
jgi:uncharacterized membrane protein YbjE (DUF340 family)